MKRKIVSMLLVLTMTAGMLAGCGGNDAKGNTAEGGEVSMEADDLTKSQEISIWMFKEANNYYDSYDSNPAVQYVEEKFNCDLTYQHPAVGSEVEQFSLMLGTGDYTDVMEITYCSESVSSLYEDGVIVDIAPYLEKYAPNFYKWVNENEQAKRSLYDDDGHLFTIPIANADENVVWGGMVYRKDILETMTGGNVQFPSGNTTPSTVADWEYVLELTKQYFDASGLADYACLILPYNGYFSNGDIVSGFGTAANYYVEDGTVKYGPVEEAFYNYLVKMNEWYEKGYIYKDFASRTNDLFYLPNTALTYGGSAGVWFGLISQLGTALSMPDYGLEVNVEAIGAPVDTDNGVTEALGVSAIDTGIDVSMNMAGFVVSTNCSEEKLIRWLTVCDYLFTDEGAMLASHGLTVEQGADENEIYQAAGIKGGAYTMDGENLVYNELLLPGTGELYVTGDYTFMTGLRLPGLHIHQYEIAQTNEATIVASDTWRTYGIDNNYPYGISFGAEDNNIISTNASNISDYLDAMVPKFIMGTEELNAETWAAFVEQLNALGVEQNLELYQTYYDNYMAK